MDFKTLQFPPVFPDAEFLIPYRAAAAAYDLCLPFASCGTKPSVVLEHVLATPFFTRGIELALGDLAYHDGFFADERNRLISEVNGILSHEVGHMLFDLIGERYFSHPFGASSAWDFFGILEDTTKAVGKVDGNKRYWSISKPRGRTVFELKLTQNEDVDIEARYESMGESTKDESLNLTRITFDESTKTVEFEISRYNSWILKSCKDKYLALLAALKPFVPDEAHLAGYAEYVSAIQAL